MAVNPESEQTTPLTDIPITDDVAWAMVEAAPDAMVMVDENGLIELVSSQAESLFGYDRIEMLGRPIEMLLPQRSRQIHSAHRTRFRAEPEVRSMGTELDLWALRSDGTEFPVEVSLSPVTIDGRMQTIAAVRDISDRQEAEKQAKLIQATIDATHDGVFMFRPDTLQFTYVNQGAVNQTGYGREELLRMSPLHIKPRFTRAEFLDLIQPLIDDVVSRHTFETVHRRKDGVDIPVEIVLEFPAEPQPGSGRVLIALVRNIRERIEAEAREQAVNTRFRSAFGDGPVPMAIVEISAHADRVILETNQAMADLLQYSPNDLVGRSFVELTHPDDRAEDEAATKRQVSGEQERFVARKRYLRSDGSIVWVQLHVAVLDRDGDKITTIGHSIDITDEIELEFQRRRDLANLEALSDVRSTLLTKHSTDQVMDLICQHARALVDADTATFSRVNDADNSLTYLAHDCQEPGSAAPEAALIDKAIESARSGTAWKSSVSSSDPRGSKGLEPSVSQPAMLVPVLGSDGVAAVLTLTRKPGEAHFKDDELVLISGFASSASTALQLDEARRIRQRTELLEDRERIGRDMHDLVIGRLFATGMALQATTTRITEPDVLKRVQTAINEIDSGIKEIRTSIYGLHSQRDWGQGARGEILAVAAESKQILGFEPRVVMSGPVDDVGHDRLTDALAALREALTNVARHAGANTVDITVTATESRFTINVTDDGIGFKSTSGTQPAKTTGHSGKGLVNIGARANALGGYSSIVSREGEGTTVEWSIPLQ